MGCWPRVVPASGAPSRARLSASSPDAVTLPLKGLSFPHKAADSCALRSAGLWDQGPGAGALGLCWVEALGLAGGVLEPLSPGWERGSQGVVVREQGALDITDQKCRLGEGRRGRQGLAKVTCKGQVDCPFSLFFASLGRVLQG